MEIIDTFAKRGYTFVTTAKSPGRLQLAGSQTVSG